MTVRNNETESIKEHAEEIWPIICILRRVFHFSGTLSQTRKSELVTSDMTVGLSVSRSQYETDFN